MYEHISIGPRGMLGECEMLKLGMINVLSGKNNSGKTTLLSYLEEPVLKPGISLDESRRAVMLREIYAALEPQRSRRLGLESRKSQFENLFEQICKSRVAWYRGEQETLKQLLLATADAADETRLLTHFVAANAIAKSYEGFFETLTSVYVKPKRSFPVKTHSNATNTVNPDGNGLVSVLFYLKNQLRSHNGRKLYESILKAFREVSKGYDFDVQSEDINSTCRLFFSLNDGEWFDADVSGHGLRDLLVILYFALSPDFSFLRIDEPELHMHPEMQRRLLAFLRTETRKQYLFATHSNVFLDSAFVDRVFLARFDGKITVSDVTRKAAVLDELGYSIADNLLSDLIVLVEGPSDREVLEEFLIKMGVYGPYNVKMWPVGGDIMGKVDLSVFAESKNVLALIDKDPKSNKSRVIFQENCQRFDIPCTRLKRYSIENYFSLRAIRQVYPHQPMAQISTIAPNAKLESQLGFDVKRCNRQIARAMELREIEGTDLYDFLLKIKSNCESLK